MKKTGETKTVCSSSYRRAFIAENNEEQIQIISSVFDSIDSWAETSKRGIWNSVQKEMSAFGMDGIHLWVTSLYSGNDDFLSDLTNGKLIKDNGAVFLSSDKSPYAIGDIVELTFIHSVEVGSLVLKYSLIYVVPPNFCSPAVAI